MLYFYHCFLIFNIIITSKIIYSYWFIITFFFILKKIPNICNRFIFDWFIFFFQSNKISYIFNCCVIYFCFQSNKICYIFNFSVIYFLFYSKIISYVFNCSVIYFFFCLKRFLTSFIMSFYILLIFYKPRSFHYYMLWKIN